MVEQSDRRELVYGVHVVFRLCEGVPDVESVKPLAHLLAREGFHPSPAVGGEELYIASDIDALVNTRFREPAPEVTAASGLLSSAGFPILMEEFPATRARCAFRWAVFKGGQVQVTLSGSVAAIPEEQKTYQEPFAQKLLSLALKLYPLAQPVYGFMADPYVDSHPPGDTHIVKRKIVTLNWVNFFGPEYVAKYGREMLAGIPGWRTQNLPDGGLFYQSRPSIVVEDEVAYKRWQREAAAYLAQYGVRIRFDYPRD